MACTSVAPCVPAPAFSWRDASATRASPSILRAPTLLKGTPLLGGKLAQSAQGSKMRRSRAAPIARAQAVSTSAPKTVTKSDSDDEWLELHGVTNWAGLLPTKEKGSKISDKLKKEIIKYGEMAQLTYDSVDLYEWSRYRSQNRYTTKVDGQLVPGKLFGDNLTDKSFFQYLSPEEGYEAVAYMYASEEAKVVRAVKAPKGQDIKEDVWIGYIAYSKTKRDIVVAWRGTMQPAEWVADAEVGLMSYKPYKIEAPKKKAPAGNKDQTGDEDSPQMKEALVFLSKAGYAGLAFVGATFLGVLSASVIGLVFYVTAKLLKAESLVGDVYNAAFGAVAALPISKFFPKIFPGFFERFFPEVEENGKVGRFVLTYAVAVGLLTVVTNLVTSADEFWSVWNVDSLIFAIFVLLPTGATAAVEAWESAGEVPQVHEGFYELYDPTGDPKKMPKKKDHKYPRKVVYETVVQLLRDHPDARTISVTGHSLGGALAVLSAYDIVESGFNLRADGVTRVPVACFAFEAPRVGNPRFKESFEENHAKKKLAAIRVVNRPDIVTQVPKAFYLQNVYYLLAAITNNDFVVNIINQVEEIGYWMKLPSAFQHVAPEQELVHDSREVDYLKKMPGHNPLNNTDAIGNYHNLEVNLHLVSGYWSEFFTRDFALCNKSADVIDPRAGVPPNWFMSVIKDMVFTLSRGPPGGAIIEPYSKELPPLNGEDNNREIGQGPAVLVAPKTWKCMPLEKDYLEKWKVGVTRPDEQQELGSPDASPKK